MSRFIFLSLALVLLCGNCINASVQDVLNRADNTVRRVQGYAMAPFNFIYRILGTTGQDQEEDKRRTHITTQSNDGSEVIAIIRKQQPYSVGLVPHLNPAIQYSNKPIIAVPPENLYVPPSSGSQYPAPSPDDQYNPSASQSGGSQDGCSIGLLKRRRRQLALGVVGALATPVAARFAKKFAGRLTTKLRERLNSGSTCGDANGGQDGGNDQNAGGGGLFGGGGLTGRSGGAFGRISSLLGGGNDGSSSGLTQRLTGKLTGGMLGRLTGGGGSSSGSGLLGRLTGGGGSSSGSGLLGRLTGGGGSSGGLGLLGRLTGGGGSSDGSSDGSSGGSSGGLLGGLTQGVMGLFGGGGSAGQAGAEPASSGGGPLGFLGGLLG